MKKCKFCGLPEGAPGRNGKSVHINRDNLCAPCYRVLEKVKYNVGALTDQELEWFEWMCKINIKSGMFVPVAQRRRLRAAQKWTCKRCGCSDLLWRDDNYTNYCKDCASDARKRRSDK